MPQAISSSSTVTISSTSSRMSGSVRSPGRLTAMPSAIVRATGTATGSPAASEPATAAQPAACTPTIRTSGIRALTASAMPPIRPPPPIGTTSRPRSGRRLDDLQADRALSGDHAHIVEGMHIGQAALALDLVGSRAGVVEGRAVQDHLGAIAARRGDLGERARSGITIVAGMPSRLAASATPCA